MLPDFLLLYAVVIVLFSLVYFFFASISFLFVRLDVPEVGRLFRGLFNVYFWMVGVTGFVAAAAFAANGRIAFMAGLSVLAAGALAVRGWLLPRIDAQQEACRAGDSAAVGRLRQVHWGGMLANVLVVASIAGSVPYIL